VGAPIDPRLPIAPVVAELARGGARRTVEVEGAVSNGLPFPVQVSVGPATGSARVLADYAS
jgi:hypothetical protein